MPRYTKTAMLLHWLTALLIISAFTLGLIMTAIPGFSPTKLRYFSWHKWLGVTVLAIAALRLLWRLFNKPPPPLASIPAWQHLAAEAMHVALYVFIFAVPVSGYLFTLSAGVPVRYLNLVQLPVFMGPNPEWKPVLREIHYWLNMSMAAAVALHVAAALKHHFIDRDSILTRMLPFGKQA
jgi:cytochrome b561